MEGLLERVGVILHTLDTATAISGYFKDIEDITYYCAGEGPFYLDLHGKDGFVPA
jgi:hypothetical protein